MNFPGCIYTASVIYLLYLLTGQHRKILLFATAENQGVPPTETLSRRMVYRLNFNPLYTNQVCDPCFMLSQSVKLLRRDF